ncbi:hypothetical protein [Haloarchaeobius sp. TZWWS8]|uniref:hypothetical protein n=1 Tax=Haloarchaeobius sp. TZWWS8 TaxID=3446121 RepID=UPI003EB79D37
MVMDHNPDSRHSFGIEDEAWAELGEVVAAEDHESKSHLLRELVYDKLREFRDDEDHDDGLHVPSRSEERAVYLAALEASNEHLRFHERHSSRVAQNLNTLNKSGVEAVLQDLRRSGYVSLMGHTPDCVSKKVYRIKPRMVHPDDWTHDERDHGKDRDISHLLTHSGESRCIGHHPNPDGTECLKCGADLVDEHDPDRCTCRAILTDVEEECPNCRAITDDLTVDA